jgi:hypothetical protein
MRCAFSGLQALADQATRRPGFARCHAVGNPAASNATATDRPPESIVSNTAACTMINHAALPWSIRNGQRVTPLDLMLLISFSMPFRDQLLPTSNECHFFYLLMPVLLVPGDMAARGSDAGRRPISARQLQPVARRTEY